MRKYLLFDLDGTLLDTITDLWLSVNHALSCFALPTHSIEAVMRMVGNGIRSLVARAVPGGEDDPKFDAVFAEFRRHYELHKNDHTAPYDGIHEMLRALMAVGYVPAVVSNKIDSAVKGLCRETFPDTVAYALGDTEGVPRKPAPDMVYAALRALGAEPSDAYFIGDSEVDVVTARNAGLPCLSVLWGFREREELLAVGGDTFFETPAELAAYLLNEAK